MISLFQKRVYKIVKKIPRGNFLSYREVAERTGYSRAWRAVGNVLRHSAELSRSHKNPSSRTLRVHYGAGKNLRIPCHRVIRSNGSIGDFNRGKNKKIALLKKEGIIIHHGKAASRITK